MQPKVLIAAGLVVAFMSGLMANGIYVATTRAFNPVQENPVATERNGTSSVTVTRTHLVEPKPVYVSNPAPISTPVYQIHRNRSSEEEALIIGGSAGAGAAIGAVAGGGKGAGIGAISGGIAGLIYDLATRNK